MTRVFYASTLFGAMSLAAALDAGTFGDRSGRCVLIASNNVAAPEVYDGFVTSPAFEPLRSRFDEVVDWNELIAPMHPSKWTPRAAEVPMLSRLIRQRMGLEDGIDELVLESIAVAPARTIGTLFAPSPITVYSDGLMSYGPTRDDLPSAIGRRTERLLHFDLVPSLTPLLLHENEIVSEVLSEASFTKIVGELPAPEVGDAAGCPVIIGQYLSQLGVLTPAEEISLHDDMLTGLVARGHRHVVFRPHPAAGRIHVRPLQESADRRGIRLTVAADGLPAEAWFAAARPDLVVSCFSTALATGARYFGTQVATVGTGLLLERLTPYENSNRIPATIVDATVPALRLDGTLVPPPVLDVAHLVRAVSYCMQPNRLFPLRESAAAYVAANGPARYFKKRRLQAVGFLPTPTSRSVTARRVVRIGRRVIAAAQR